MSEEVKKRARDKAGENLWQIVETFTGRQGRKVAFGMWGFWVATALRRTDLISAEIWWWCFLVCALLIGFGTIIDTLVERLGAKVVDVLAQFVGTRVSVAAAKIEKVEVTTDGPAA